MSKRVDVLNGPNLNLLGRRQPEIYGHKTLEDIQAMLENRAEFSGLEITFFQSNNEGAIIDRIHAARGNADGIIINPAAHTHTSIAILDALKAFDGPVVEVHLSNVHQREPFRHQSYISQRAEGVIAGLGISGYRAALDFLIERLEA